MFFEKRDPVSIFTLMAASHGVLRDLLRVGKDEDFASLIKDNPTIPKENRTLWVKDINKYQNFFKHANTDPDESIEFNSEVLPIFIYDSVQMLERLTNAKFFEGSVFNAWHVVSFPELLRDDAPSRAMLPFAEQMGLDPNNFKALRQLLNSAEARRSMLGEQSSGD